MKKNYYKIGEYSLVVLSNYLIAYYFLGLKGFDITSPIYYFGDGIPTLAHFKEIFNGDFPFFGFPSSELMSAPFKYELGDFPLPMMSVWLFIKALNIFTDNYVVGLHLFIIISFVLNPIAMYYVLKRLKVNIWIAIAISIAYNFVPFHFARFGHVFYINYFFLPLLTYILLIMMNKKPLLFKLSSTNKKYSFDFSKKNIVIMIILLLSSTWNIYYTFYFVMFVFIYGLATFFYRKNKYHIFSALIVAGLSIAPFVVNMIPYKLYSLENGKNNITKRGVVESEIYGLKIIQLVIPVDNHRNKHLRNRNHKYYKQAVLTNENRSSTLGVIGTLGFLLLIFMLIKYNTRIQVLGRLATLNLISVLFATIGGFSAVFAVLVTAQLRGHNRISIFIATFCFIAIALLINYIIKNTRISKYFKNFYAAFFLGIAITAFSIYDQVQIKAFKNSGHIKAAYNYNMIFFKTIESLYSKEEEIKVMQYPYMVHPEAGPILHMGDYAHMKGYLHSDRIKWSYGAVRNRKADKWNKELVKKPLAEQIKILKQYGFNGIYIDRFGYQNSANEMIEQLKKMLNIEPLISEGKRRVFFKIK